MPYPVRLRLVEDLASYRRSFEKLVGSSDEFVLDQSFETVEDLLACGSPAPDLIVMDLQLPGASGHVGTRVARARWPTAAVVVLTLVDQPEAIFRALRAGASGYIVKGTPPDGIFASLREAHAGGTQFAPDVARHVLGAFAAEELEAPLSEREVEVLSALADGLTKAGIAGRLFLSPHTVDSHLRSVYDKLHVTNAAEATAKGVRLGVI